VVEAFGAVVGAFGAVVGALGAVVGAFGAVVGAFGAVVGEEEEDEESGGAERCDEDEMAGTKAPHDGEAWGPRRKKGGEGRCLRPRPGR
jgi:hypothetical protein